MVKVTFRKTDMDRLLVAQQRIKANVPARTMKDAKTYAKLVRSEMRKIITSEAIYSKTGNLARTLTIVKVQKGYDIISPMKYAKFVDQGFRGHFIFPQTRKFMKFEVAGKTVFAKKVSHPGFAREPKGMRFAERAVRRTRETYTQLVLNSIDTEIRRYST